MEQLEWSICVVVVYCVIWIVCVWMVDFDVDQCILLCMLVEIDVCVECMVLLEVVGFVVECVQGFEFEVVLDWVCIFDGVVVVEVVFDIVVVVDIDVKVWIYGLWFDMIQVILQYVVLLIESNFFVCWI